MPKSSDTNTGPSSGSVISFLTELMKCLSPVMSSRTTNEIDRLKRHLQKIKGVFVRLLNGDKIVPDCGYGCAHIPLKALKWTYNKDGKPQFHPEMCFLVKEIMPAPMSVAAVLSAPVKRLVSGYNVFDIVIRAYIPGKVHVVDFTIERCVLTIPEDDVFVSLSSLRHATNMVDYYEKLRCSYVANNFTLTVSTGHDGYRFIITNNDIQPSGSGCTEVPYEVFAPTSN